MSEANPLDLVKSLRDTLEAYLPTTLPVSRRYPLLAEEFRALLKKQPLVKGPYVEALPDFEKGRKLIKLLATNGGCLNDGLAGLPDSWLERDPLIKFKQQLLTEGVLSADEISAIDERVRNEINTAAEAAANAPWPELRDLTAETYAGSYQTEGQS